MASEREFISVNTRAIRDGRRNFETQPNDQGERHLSWHSPSKQKHPANGMTLDHDRFNIHQPLLHVVSSPPKHDWNPRHLCHEFATILSDHLGHLKWHAIG
ncbi:hypothetical protein TNCV_4473961 [Trichonephila clavipes]|nr:hypothetical protein TNCV_4473961 [Trichonephila clavipes]